MHGYFLITNDAKMSKSSGEFLRVQLLIDKGYDPIAYRYLCLMAHYRSQLNFSWDALDAAQTGLERLRRTIRSLDPATEVSDDFAARFMEKINDDLNFPQALALAHEMLKSDLESGVKKATLLKFDEAFGLGLASWVPRSIYYPPDVGMIAEARWKAREAGDWAEADRMRSELAKRDWTVRDAKGYYTLERSYPADIGIIIHMLRKAVESGNQIEAESMRVELANRGWVTNADNGYYTRIKS